MPRPRSEVQLCITITARWRGGVVWFAVATRGWEGGCGSSQTLAKVSPESGKLSCGKYKHYYIVIYMFVSFSFQVSHRLARTRNFSRPTELLKVVMNFSLECSLPPTFFYHWVPPPPEPGSPPLKSAWASRVFATVRCSLPEPKRGLESRFAVVLSVRRSVGRSVVRLSTLGMMLITAKCCSSPRAYTPVLYFAKFGLTATCDDRGFGCKIGAKRERETFPYETNFFVAS